MGFLKKIIKNGIGLAGNQVMNMANSATGGLAGKIFNATVNKVNKNSGIIGKVARGLGKKFLMIRLVRKYPILQIRLLNIFLRGMLGLL